MKTKTQEQKWVKVSDRLNLKTPMYRCNLCGRAVKVPQGKRPPMHCSCDVMFITCREIMLNLR